MRSIGRVLLALVALSAIVNAQAQVVRVTVPKANVRSEPNDKAPILQQATPKDQIEWRATEGDWFKVLLPPNPALGGARVEAYISKKVSKLEAAPAMPVASTPAPVDAAPAVPKIDTHAANVFLGSIVDGALLKQESVSIGLSGNRLWWILPSSGDRSAAADRRPAFVVSIGDRAGFPADGLAPVIVKLATPPSDLSGQVIGSHKPDGKDWKLEQAAFDVTQGTVGVWNLKASKDLKPGDYAIIMRPSGSKALAPEIAWTFTVK